MQYSMSLIVIGISWMKMSESYSKDLMQRQQMRMKAKVRLTQTIFSITRWLIFTFNHLTDESEATTSFLALLSTWDKDELDEKLANRVLVSQRAVAKLIRAFDRLLQRNQKITQALKGGDGDGMLCAWLCLLIVKFLIKSCFNFQVK